jgi:uncharacterized protein YidB (DUF937 family)
MGLFDTLGGSLGGMLEQAAVNAAPGLIAEALAKTNLGGLQGVVNQLEQGGLGDQVKSWLGNGANMQVTPAQIEAALGNEQVRQLAAQFGIPVDGVLNFLAQHLPAAVDQASPDGKLAS